MPVPANEPVAQLEVSVLNVLERCHDLDEIKALTAEEANHLAVMIWSNPRRDCDDERPALAQALAEFRDPPSSD